jgi:hypothetical protein
MCARQVSWKTGIFYLACEKQEKKSSAKPFLAPIFSFLHTTKKLLFLL